MITTHVLDTTHGRPAAGVHVILEHSHDAEWHVIGTRETDADGRVTSFTNAASLAPGLYRLVFDSGAYFGKTGITAFYPQVILVFETVARGSHYHVPLLLGPFGYTTYRGS